jgi:uncharacterized protein (TIGR00369 family)
MREVVKFRDCFVCGDNNECGLKARFFVADDGSVITEYTALEKHIGYAGILHGGILASLLDEVMIKAVLKDDILAVTASMDIKFKKPIYTGETIKLSGQVISQKGRIFKTSGTATVNSVVVGSATGIYIEAGKSLASKLNESLE